MNTTVNSESVENYLETILILSNTNTVVRAIDVANKLGFKKSSVSIAMKNLRDNDYISVDEHGSIKLTKSGMKIAVSIYERHEWFTKWLISLGVDKKTASEDACKIEHVLSKKSFNAIKKSINL